jgi:hypothetical protein
LLVEHLGWSADQIQSESALIESYSRHLPELGETLRPTALVPAAHGEGIQLLLQALPSLAALDQKGTSGEHLWRATSQERFERLLRETGVEAGLLFNGAQLRLVVAPKGESSGHLTFPMAELGEVSGIFERLRQDAADYPDTMEQRSDALQERIDSDELFFWEPDEACAFEAQVRAYGAVKGKKKLPWRYRWPDDVRDDVLGARRA